MKNLLVIALLICKTLAYSQEVDESKIVFIDKAFSSTIQIAKDSIHALMQTKKIPGFSVCVSKNGKVVWAEGFGYSDLENKVRVSINTKFRIGSVSKSLTATGLGKLLESKKIFLDSQATNYVNYYPAKKFSFTIKQLASHTAGIRHYDISKGEFYSTKKYASVEESISIFKNDTLLFQPGTRHYYSSNGYNLLSAAIESSSGKPFLQYMNDEVFIPLKMYNTTADYNDSIIENRTSFYELKSDKIVNAIYVDNSNKWAGGGFLSAPIDLVKLANALLKGRFISASVVKEMWTPYSLSSGEKNIYGLGFRIEKDAAGRNMVHHGGTSVGGGAFLMIYPEQELIIAIAYNLLPQNFNRGLLAEIFLKETK